MLKVAALVAFPLLTGALCLFSYANFSPHPRYARVSSDTPFFMCEYNKGPCYFENGYLKSTHWPYNAANNMLPMVTRGWWVMMVGEPFERAGAKVILANFSQNGKPYEFDTKTTAAVPYYSLEFTDLPVDNPTWQQALPRWSGYFVVWSLLQLLMVWKVKHG